MIYQGRAATTGNSRSMAFEEALFRAYPNFAAGRLEAEPVSPNYLLVRAVPDSAGDEEHEDPILGAYLDFLGEQMKANPHLLQGLTAASIERARDLVGDMEVDPEEHLGDDPVMSDAI